MKLLPAQLIWKKPRIFWSVFAAPILFTSIGWRIAPQHWCYYIIALSSALAVTLTLIESISTGRIEDNWGRLDKKDQPSRYWIQIGTWIAMLLCATAFPVVIALM